LGVASSRLGRSLGAYTATPSTLSSTGALVPVPESRRRPPTDREWPPRLGEGFGLRCLQPLSLTAWLPGAALPDNR